MWIYEKRLQFPVNIKEPNAKLAQFIMSQYGGPDGEMGASMRYLSQRYAMPYKEGKAVLTDIGTEELCRYDEIKFLAVHLRVSSTAAVYQGFHLSAYCVEIDWGSHYDHIGIHHFFDDFCRVVFLRAWLLVQTACTASRTVMDCFVSQENLFHFMIAFCRTTHKFVTERV